MLLKVLTKAGRLLLTARMHHSSSCQPPRITWFSYLNSMVLFNPRSLILPLYLLWLLRTIVIFNGSEQKVLFEGNTGLSKPDIDPEAAEAEWKFFRNVIFAQY